MKRLYVILLVIVLVGGLIFTGRTPTQWKWQKTCGGTGTDMSSLSSRHLTAAIPSPG